MKKKSRELLNSVIVQMKNTFPAKQQRFFRDENAAAVMQQGTKFKGGREGIL